MNTVCRFLHIKIKPFLILVYFFSSLIFSICTSYHWYSLFDRKFAIVSILLVLCMPYTLLLIRAFIHRRWYSYQQYRIFRKAEYYDRRQKLKEAFENLFVTPIPRNKESNFFEKWFKTKK